MFSVTGCDCISVNIAQEVECKLGTRGYFKGFGHKVPDDKKDLMK